MKNYIYEDGLSSGRLVTRKLTLSDIPQWSDFFDDPDAVTFLPSYGKTTTLERAQHWIERQLQRYDQQKFGLQAILLKGTNEFIGQCGLLEQEVNGVKEIEVGYHMQKKYWGNGYAPEAARLFIYYAFENHLTDSVISIIAKENLKSKRVAEKNGLKLEGDILWMEMETSVYRIKKENWSY